MNGAGLRRMIAASVVAVVLAGFASNSAFADWSFSVGGACDDGYTWVTRTSYRTERRPVTKICYRNEWQPVTVWVTERRLVEEVWYDNWGCRRTQLVCREFRVPRTEYRWVQVPYETTVYEYVQVPYTEYVRVARAGGFALQTRNFAVQVGGGGFAFSLRGGSERCAPPPPPVCGRGGRR